MNSGTVLKPQPHPVAGFDPKPLLELVRDEDGLAPQFGIGILSLAPEQGDLLGLLLNRFRKGASQIHAGAILAGTTVSRQGAPPRPCSLHAPARGRGES